MSRKTKTIKVRVSRKLKEQLGKAVRFLREKERPEVTESQIIREGIEQQISKVQNL